MCPDEDDGLADAQRDALGLVEAVHRMDRAGVMTIMRHGNAELIAVALARICADLVEDFARWRGDEQDDMLKELRAAWTAGSG